MVRPFEGATVGLAGGHAGMAQDELAESATVPAIASTPIVPLAVPSFTMITNFQLFSPQLGLTRSNSQAPSNLPVPFPAGETPDRVSVMTPAQRGYFNVPVPVSLGYVELYTVALMVSRADCPGGWRVSA